MDYTGNNIVSPVKVKSPVTSAHPSTQGGGTSLRIITNMIENIAGAT